MTAVVATAPCRVDLAGGTLDLWPLGVLLEGALTVHVAVDILTGCRIDPGGSRWTFAARGATPPLVLDELPARPEGRVPAAHVLACLVVRHFNLPPCSVETWSDAPRGSGLGASSSLCMALIAAAARLAGRAFEPRDAVLLAANLETRVLDLPAGTQDHWAAWCGGAGVVEHAMEGQVRQPLDAHLGGLGALLVLADTGVAHHSGQNNWTVFRGALERAPGVREALGEVALAARDMRVALESEAPLSERLTRATSALAGEWSARRLLSPAVSCPEIEALAVAAQAAGGALKACGAGGGGCVVALPGTPDGRPALEAALARAGGRLLAAGPHERGVSVEAETTP